MIRYEPLDALDDYARAELAFQRERFQTRGDRFRAAAAEALTDWRLGRASQPANFSGAAGIIRAGIGEIAEIRLLAAYAPLFRTLQRIENQLAIFVAIRDDPYAPDPRRRNLVGTGTTRSAYSPPLPR